MDSADFLVMDEFEAFKNALSLGKRIYLKLEDGRVLTPLLLGFTHTFDEKSSLALEFSTKFTSSNENDELADMVKQSISMGKKLDLSREVYSAFVDSHANTAIHDFMNGALDVAKNSILSTTGQAISWDENGLRLRKWNSDRTGYEDEQIWMKDNLIVFTEDAWQHAKMAIGHIKDDELGDLWGVVADNLVGKMVAGENLYIHSTKPDGENMSFVVDGSGVTTYNSHQKWARGDWGIAIDPEYGLFMNDGKNPLYKTVGDKQIPYCCKADGSLRLTKNEMGDTYSYPDGANVWIGLDGNVYFRGNFYAENGYFCGELKGATGSFSGELNAAKINAATITGTVESDRNGKIVGPEICVPNEDNPKFHVDSDGNTTITGGKFSAPEISGGKISGTNIYGGTYHDQTGKTSFSLGYTSPNSGQTFNDLWYGKGEQEVLRIHDNVSGSALYFCGIELANGAYGQSTLNLGKNVIAHYTLA